MFAAFEFNIDFQTWRFEKSREMKILFLHGTCILIFYLHFAVSSHRGRWKWEELGLSTKAQTFFDLPCFVSLQVQSF